MPWEAAPRHVPVCLWLVERPPHYSPNSWLYLPCIYLYDADHAAFEMRFCKQRRSASEGGRCVSVSPKDPEGMTKRPACTHAPSHGGKEGHRRCDSAALPVRSEAVLARAVALLEVNLPAHAPARQRGGRVACVGGAQRSSESVRRRGGGPWHPQAPAMGRPVRFRRHGHRPATPYGCIHCPAHDLIPGWCPSPPPSPPTPFPAHSPEYPSVLGPPKPPPPWR